MRQYWPVAIPLGILLAALGLATASGSSSPKQTTTGVPTTKATASRTSAGEEWSRVSDDENVFGGDGIQKMNSVAAGGPGLVAVGSDRGDAAVWLSTDGLSWTRASQDQRVFGGKGTQVMESVTVGGPGLVAVGGDNFRAAVWLSKNGGSWKRIPHNKKVLDDGWYEGNYSLMSSVTAGGPGLVAVGSVYDAMNCDAAVWFSKDGRSWKLVFGDSGSVYVSQQWMTSVIAGGLGLIATGAVWGGTSDMDEPETNAAVWLSKNSRSWPSVPNRKKVFGRFGDGDQWMNSIAAGGPGVVAASSVPVR
jgi:hypothetical protein